MSGLTILGNPAESYKYGTMFLWTFFSHLLVTIATSRIFIPLYINLDITSAITAYEVIFSVKYFNKKA
jgi:Na+/proline symporter